MPGLIGGAQRRESIRRAGQLIEDVGMSHRSDHLPHELSGGERQRVAVARSLMNDPRLILADEPTGNLDERNSGVVMELLFGLVEQYGKTMLLVTHESRFTGRAQRGFTLEHGVLNEA